MELGADDYVTKPFSRDELITAVETQLKKRHTIAQKHESTLSTLRRNVIYALPHELRTPLPVVLGNAELLVEDYESMPRESIRDMSLAILKHGRRIHHLFENYLAYAQIEMAASDPRPLTALRHHVIKDARAVSEAEAGEPAREANRGGGIWSWCSMAGPRSRFPRPTCARSCARADRQRL
jgi:K+-sensing histidine kinase KdpD